MRPEVCDCGAFVENYHAFGPETSVGCGASRPMAYMAKYRRSKIKRRIDHVTELAPIDERWFDGLLDAHG
jgi:hypothetical protein